MSKGGGFENEVAKKLSIWFTEGIRDDVFGRSDGSGARFTKRRKKGKNTANQGGDISFTDVVGEPLIKIWSVEAKTGYSGKRKVKDADGDIVKIPIYSPAKKGEKKKDKDQRTIIGWKDKVELAPWDVLDLIDSSQNKPVIQMMWEQCARDGEFTNRNPILVFRRNGRKPCICMKRSYYLGLCYFFAKIEAQFILSVNIKDDQIVIMQLDKFFEWASSPRLILTAKN